MSRAVTVGAVVILGAWTVGCQPDGVGAPTAEPDDRSSAAQMVPTVARVMEPSDMGLASPAGLTFSPRAGMLLVVTRAPGAPPGSATVVELVTLAGERVGSVTIPIGVSDPVNMAFDGSGNRLLVLPSPDELVAVRARPDGSLDAALLERIDARSFGLEDPRGVTIDPSTGRILLLDAAGPRLVVVTPHAQLGLERPTIATVDLPDLASSVVRGVAFDPGSRRLHVLDAGARVLHELTDEGRLVASHDVSESDLRNTHAMTFAPSGDTTDDPSEMSLYIADRGVPGAATEGSFAESGHITEMTFVVAGGGRTGALSPLFAAAPIVSGIRLQTIQTSLFSPPSPDPAGIVYVSHLNRLLISDSEVNEMSIFKGVNLFWMSSSGGHLGSMSTIPFSDEPTDVAYNPANRHLFLSDDTGTRSVYELDPGPDGLYLTGDDMVTSFKTGAFGSSDPEGVAYDVTTGILYVLDGVNAEVYRVSPGNNGRFDGVPSTGDDVVTSFDTERFGLRDPEGITFDADYGHLYIVGKPAGSVFHVTTSGTLLRTIDVSSASPRKPAGLAYAPSSVNPLVKSLWIVDRGVDNDSDPKENDGKVYEFSFASFSGNAQPTVTITAPPSGAALDQGALVTFTGTASDTEDGNITAKLAWTSSRDGSIGTGGSVSTNTLSLGTHTIMASVTDNGGAQASASITVSVSVPGLTTIERRVVASSDDAEEKATGSVSLTSSDLELVYDGSIQTVGMRFNGVMIPKGATIVSASIQFQVDETGSEATSLVIRGQAADNAPTFTTTSRGISSRPPTGNFVEWSPVPWPTKSVAGSDQRTPDIALVIQEIVSRSGWSAGNSLVIIITGTGKRTAEAYDGVPSAAPLLRVSYLAGS